ncbi:MAG: ComEA family DNA-binding protein, partial [Myxococcota bacterium]|nr:ComEA family DNA-binding protein [Myxococcota bacterium]
RPMTEAPPAARDDSLGPRVAKVPAPRPPAAFEGTPAHSSGGPIVDLNTATIADLDALPGIGPAKARTIVNWRDQHGPFTSVDQLDEVPGIGPATIAGLRTRVSIGSERGGS